MIEITLFQKEKESVKLLSFSENSTPCFIHRKINAFHFQWWKVIQQQILFLDIIINPESLAYVQFENDN